MSSFCFISQRVFQEKAKKNSRAKIALILFPQLEAYKEASFNFSSHIELF
jgi:hypothetical protein